MSGLRGRKVLVTGADGFIGSHLTERLVAEGANVRALVMYNSFNSWGWLDEAAREVLDGLEVVEGDVRDAELVSRAVRDRDVVLHLAALVSIPYSYQAGRAFVDTNVTGTLNVLEAARTHGTERVVHTSTSEVYGTPETVPITEDHPLNAQSPYAATKIGADQLATSYHRSFDLPVIVLRPFNTYGPRQSARAVIPTILSQLLSGADEVRLGALEPRRDFTYVDDTVEGFVRAASAPESLDGRVVQLGSGRDVSIGELFEIALGAVGSDAKVVTEERRKRPDKSEVDRLLSDPRRARELLGWTPSTSLEEGLAATADWIRENLGRFEVGRYDV